MKNGLGIFGFFMVIAVIVAIFAGWGMNIAAIISTVNDPITAAFLLRIVGIFVFPLGAILGWFL